jgi:hypothetical protein
MTEEKPSEAPFSEPREWEECPECCTWGVVGEDTFAPCPECGQPPRCRVGHRAGMPCPRPATVSVFSGERADFCGQHYLDYKLTSKEEEWGFAAEHIGDFRKLAEKLGVGTLLEALDLAYAECEMRAYSARQEREMIWEK